MKSVKKKIIKKRRPVCQIRFGIGYDVHKFARGRRLVLGGIEIPSEFGLLGHSDADVLLHAICDALLGAVALGDIGIHFPNTDQKYKDIPSIRLLEKVSDLLKKKGYQVCNIDTSIILESPKISKFTKPMCRCISKALGIPAEAISVKATTNEGLGAFGRSEGCAAFAIASVMRAGRI